ncbi:MAG: hypothetical protein HOK27_01195 [Rhodobacteraceae bacterium]|jgi:hypothetical protein|nr:hypothetical protein [Paracoccaceae bacterium]
MIMIGIGTFSPETDVRFAEGYKLVNEQLSLTVPMSLKMTVGGLKLQ